MKISDDTKKWIILLIINLVLSILVFYISTLNELSMTDKVLLTFGTFAFCVQLEILYYVAVIAAQEQREQQLWTLCGDGDKQLTNIRNNFHQIVRESNGKKDLFVVHFLKSLDDLAEKIVHAAERQELEVEADHFLNVENVLDAFHGDSQRIWRYTWSIEENCKLFDDAAWKLYFERTAKMAQEGTISEIRIVLVLCEPRLINSPRVKKLLDFYHTNELKCFTIDAPDYKYICRTNGVSIGCIDFGVYGNSLLFLTKSYEPEVTGTFTKNPSKIALHVNLFDQIWGSAAVAKRNPSTAMERVTWEDLRMFDDSEPL